MKFKTKLAPPEWKFGIDLEAPGPSHAGEPFGVLCFKQEAKTDIIDPANKVHPRVQRDPALQPFGRRFLASLRSFDR